jgi:hypothetical protein
MDKVEYCEKWGEVIHSDGEIHQGHCNSCRTYCTKCGDETTGESIFDGLCSDCEEDRLDDCEDDEDCDGRSCEGCSGCTENEEV